MQVDAALDLSHTQNIGRMIKAHFPQSQFLVVSLKEGMFNNANVIFRTKFVDGVSTVTRNVNDAAAQRATRCAPGAVLAAGQAARLVVIVTGCLCRIHLAGTRARQPAAGGP